jgi:hypothetical protein
MRYQNLVILILASVLTACGGGGGANSYSVLPESDHFIQTNSSFTNKLDILFVINDQPSMSSFQQELVQSMSSFMSLFQTKGFDFKIAVVTSSAYMADPTLNGYNVINESLADFNDFNGTVHSGTYVLTPTVSDLFNVFAINAQPNKNTAGQDGRALSSMRQALQNTRPINDGFLRADSFLAVVLVDNQDDFSGNGRCTGCNVNQRYNSPNLDPVSVYKDFLDTVTGTSGATARYNVSAMTQTGVPCQGGANMPRIMDFVSQTNGVLGDICQVDFGPSLAEFADKIAVLSSRFILSGEPVMGSIIVQVNGNSVPENATNGWTYDPAAVAIVFHGSAVPAQGDDIYIDYDPVSVIF